ncbi:hypothetical protein F4778DRAFT_263577 [Xylariomycetidae sp. FL2044]|nr:hypothetical protein F4778DRAFT_263577 [Xylariomycetidae sp. FL2044]
MPSLGQCSRGVGWIVLVALTGESQALHDARYKIHQLDKAYDVLRHPKRDPTCQQSGYTLCDGSVGGGCCPDNYECGTSSCTATTAGPSTACGQVGYYNCPIEAGAGSCCPVGFICAVNGGDDCIPPAGQSYSMQCPASYFACASSLGYGCCQDGMLCGSAYCYSNTPATYPVSEKVTTTNAEGSTITTTVTRTTVITPGAPDASSTGTAEAASGVPKLVLSTVSKVPAIETGGNGGGGGGGGGLSQGALGGIIGAIIVVLIAIIVAAVIILRRLRRTEKAARAAAESRRASSTGGQQSHKPGFGRPSVSEVDGTDVDPLTLRPSGRPLHIRARSDSSNTDRSPSRGPAWLDSNSSTPPVWGPGYVSPPLSDGRTSSLDNYGGGGPENHAGRLSQTPSQRVSCDSQASGAGSRHWSNASEVEGAHGISELDALDNNVGEGAAAARRRSNSATRPPKVVPRRTSDPSGVSRARGDAAVAAMPLGTVSEMNELQSLHGYYGPPNHAVGQTAARLSRPDSTNSSVPGRKA